MTVTVDTHEENQEPRYLIIIRSALIASVALATTMTGAQQMAKAYEHEPQTEVVIRSLPLEQADRAEAADLLESITRVVTHVRMTDTIRLTVDRAVTVAPADRED